MKTYLLLLLPTFLSRQKVLAASSYCISMDGLLTAVFSLFFYIFESFFAASLSMLLQTNPKTLVSKADHCCRGTKNWQENTLATFQVALSALSTEKSPNLRSCYDANVGVHGWLFVLENYFGPVFQKIPEILPKYAQTALKMPPSSYF